jgi:short-subunit dehydrogenase
MTIERPLEPQKRAIVIGASSGIGAALVRHLVHEGYRVAALARREAKLKELCEQSRNSKPIRSIARDLSMFAAMPAWLILSKRLEVAPDHGVSVR